MNSCLKKINRKLFFIATFLLFPLGSFAQGENDNWYFGDKAGLNFSTSTPTVLLNSQMYNHEAVGAVSDANGDLLFYTNSETIWNRDHGIMVTGLTGSNSTGQTYIVPHPNNTGLFYVITMPEGMTASYIAYSIVDMALGSLGSDGKPLGGVSSNNKNIPIVDENNLPLAYTTEAVTGTMHSDNRSIWILIPHGSKLYSYKVDANGFNNSPVTSNLTFSGLFEYYGTVKISPNLSNSLGLPFTNFVVITRMASPFFYKEMKVHSFNNSTGLLTSDYELLINSTKSYIGDFTSNGLLLYAGPLMSSGNGDVLVFDLLGNPNNIMNVVHSSNVALGAIQRAVNDEIYLSYLNNGYISKIVNPDSFANAYVDQNNIYLSGRNCRVGLPQLVPVRNPSGSSCLKDLALIVPETHNSFTYETSNTITTAQNYQVDINQNIILSAGSAIEMYPNTFLKAGSVVLAEIEGCIPTFRKPENRSFKTININIDLDEDIKDGDIGVYPNPSNGIITIANPLGGTVSYEVYNVVGQKVANGVIEGSKATLDLSNNQAGIYLIKLHDSQSNNLVIKKLLIK